MLTPLGPARAERTSRRTILLPPMEPLLLGIDVGSSAVKAGLFTLSGEARRAARVSCPSHDEQDPETWWAAVQAALDQLDTSHVAAVGVCGRGGTSVLLDRDGAVLAPSIHDGRAADIASALRESQPGLSPQSTALLARALWWQEAHQCTLATAFSAKDFIVWKLTGGLVSDPASGGDTSGIGRPLIPAREPWSLAGHTREQGLLAAGLPVAVGWHDGAAAAFGAGAAESGSAPVTLGTTAVFRVVAPSLPPGVRKYWDLTPGLTVTGGDIPAAGRAYAWARGLLPGADAERSPAGARGLTFLPHFAGRIAPDRHPGARAMWWGMRGNETADDLLRAIVEGVAFSLRQVRDWLAGQGLTADRIVTTGGGSRNQLQVQVLADIFGQDVLATALEEGCRGASFLGGVAAGLIDLEQARTMRPDYVPFYPNVSNRDVYDRAFERFLAVQAAGDMAPSGPLP